MSSTRLLAMAPPRSLRLDGMPNRAPPRPKRTPDDEETLRTPPDFQPPDLPLPSPSLTPGEMLIKFRNHPPVPSPIASPFSVAPAKLVDSLVLEETRYLEELLVLQRVISEKLVGHELDCLAAPVERLIDLSSELRHKLSQRTSYFSEPQKDCLLHFSRTASVPYQSYFEVFKIGVSGNTFQSSERIRLLELLHTLDHAGEADRHLDWLLRRPLSRVRAYFTMYKKLLHSSDDAMELFLAYETFHDLLIEARETLELARAQYGSESPPLSLGHKVTQRTVSGGSSSTVSSSNSKICNDDDVLGSLAPVNTDTCKSGGPLQDWTPLAPVSMPPTPPHSAVSTAFGMTAPLRVIRENSQLSFGGESNISGITPDAKEHSPFEFLLPDDDITPKASTFPKRYDGPLSGPSLKDSPGASLHDFSKQSFPTLTELQVENTSVSFPAPPVRKIPHGSVLMTKSKSVDLFSETSYTDQFLRAPNLDFRSKTLHDVPRELADAPEIRQSDEFDIASLDLPTLPAFDFGDGIRRPSSVALKFSPNTMTNFGIPLRKVPAPTPMILPDVAPLRISPQKTRMDSQADTLAHRRLGNELSLRPTVPSLDSTTTSPERNVIFSTMVECYTWSHGTWTPILMDNVDPEGKMKTVRSSRLSIFFQGPHHGSLELYDRKETKIINVFSVLESTSIIRDDPCDLSVGLDVGSDKVYYMFRAETPDKANLMQHALNQAKFAAPHTGFVTPVLPITPLWPEKDPKLTPAVLESLKIKLYIFDNGKWVNRGSARLTIRLDTLTKDRRVILTGKTKKNERVLLIDHVAVAGDCDAISKTGISVKTKSSTYMLQFKGGEKERSKVLDMLVD